MAVGIKKTRHFQVTFRRWRSRLDGLDVSLYQRAGRHTCSVSSGFSQNAVAKAGSLLGHKCITDANNTSLGDSETTLSACGFSKVTPKTFQFCFHARFPNSKCPAAVEGVWHREGTPEGPQRLDWLQNTSRMPLVGLFLLNAMVYTRVLRFLRYRFHAGK